jgi:hypothetical protein
VKSINLSSHKLDLAGALRLAAKGPVLLTEGGQEFVLSKADDFEAEVEALRNSRRFQAFLDRRMKRAGWTPLSEIEREIADELKK